MKKPLIFLFLIFIILSFVPKAFAANWYVNNTASGSNNGTSWTNAWESFGNISWERISRGDTIYISGGSTLKTYNETLSIGAAGSSGNNVIIRVGQDSGHNGVVIIDGQHSRTDCVTNNGNSYVTLDGEYNGSRHIRCIDSTRYGVNFTNARECRVLYVEIKDTGDSEDDHGLVFSGGWDGEVGYCRIDNAYQDALRLTTTAGVTAFDQAAEVHHNIITNINDDGCVMAEGYNFHHNTIGPWRTPRGTGHPDGIQMMKGWNRIHSNVFYEGGNNNNGSHALLFIDMDDTGDNGHHRIFNNIFYVAGQRFLDNRFLAIKFKWEEPGMTIDDVVVANNTFVDIPWNAVVLSLNSSSDRLRNWQIKNNLAYNCATGISGTPINLGNANYTTSDVVVTRNVVNAGPSGDQGFTFDGVRYNSAAAFEAATGFVNSNARPSFVSYIEGNGTGSDYHLSESDTAAIDKGLTLSNYFTVDRDGTLRVQGAWDVGAYEYGSSTLKTPDNLTIIN